MIGKLILVEKYDQYMGGVDFSYQFTSYYDLKVCKMVEKVVLSKVIVVLMYKPYNILLCSNYTMNYFNGHSYLALLFCFSFHAIILVYVLRVHCSALSLFNISYPLSSFVHNIRSFICTIFYCQCVSYCAFWLFISICTFIIDMFSM